MLINEAGLSLIRFLKMPLQDVDYEDIFENGDPRVESWFFMDTVWNLAPIVVAYVVFATVVGPQLMKNRKPYDWRFLLVAYNIAMTGVMGWFFYQFGIHGWFTTYTLFCQPVDFSDNEEAVWVAKLCYYYMWVKLIELMDTVFFVLRKRHSSITFVHVSHHSLAPLVMWGGVKFAPGGYNTMFCFVNAFVHMLIYIYYSISAMRPGMKKSTTWKKILTLVQLMQFVILLAYMVPLYNLSGDKCRVSPTIYKLYLYPSATYLFLYVRVYINNYAAKTQTECCKNVTDDAVNGRSLKKVN